MYSSDSANRICSSNKLVSNNSFFRCCSKPSVLVDPVTFMNGRRLTLNVSGCRFRINEYYLKQYPETLLGCPDRERYYDHTQKEYFFDRDPHIFRHIFNFYKSGKLHYSTQDCHESFIDELKFFRMKIADVSACCCDSLIDHCSFVPVKNESKSVEETTEDNPRAPVTIREKVWLFVEDPQSSLAAKVCYYFSCAVIIISVAVNTWETVPVGNGKTYGEMYPKVFFAIDSACVTVFTTEYIIRLYAAPSRWRHAKQVMTMIDLAAILPYFVDLSMKIFSQGSSGSLPVVNALVMLRVLRIFRIFKLARHSKRLRALSDSIRKSASELGFILFTYLIVVVLFASVLYYAERGDEHTRFDDIPQSMWYTVVTTTTLGYGDIVPSTIQGKLVGSLCCLMGVLVIALPVPIIQMKTKSLAKD
ncbi:potassium voltage-gated channel subfamily D member 2-like isoform X1 [Rhopilema esculentum]|uniref:potassium voltage-gated channel subfamily D member 2-like isoform X1 n=1 Tax=Rhopilema esculentum TaxID=499914 RepID=UPI0031D08768